MAQNLDDEGLLACAATGDETAWGRLIGRQFPRLERCIGFRLDPRLRGRIDAADVVQEASLLAAERRVEFLAIDPPVPLFVWLRGVAFNRMLHLHRHHLGAQRRSVGREQPLHRRSPDPGDTSASLADRLANSLTPPADGAARAEFRQRVCAALDAMDPVDREVLALRHFEQLTSAEAAAVIGIEERAASKRYLRALKRLREQLGDSAGDTEAGRQ